MYSVYQYPAGATAANILADVVALLTGETDPANLAGVTKITQASTTWSGGVGSGFSGLTPDALIGQYVYTGGVNRGIVLDNDATTVTVASFDSASVTAIVSPFEIYISWAVAGWSVFDASAGTNAVCIRAALADSGYKYVVLDVNTAGYLLLKTFESWNAGTHTGTNVANFSTDAAQSPRINITTGGYLYIGASARHIIMHCYQNSVWGNPQLGATGVFEYARKNPADTVANGYPPFFFWNLYVPSSRLFFTRVLLADGSDGVGATTVGFVATEFGNIATQTLPTNSVPLTSDKSLRYLLANMLVWHSISAPFWGGEFSTYSEVYLAPYNVGNSLDERIYNGNTYVLFAVGSTFRFAVRKG